MDVDELAELRESWLLRLQAERKSPKTRRSYREGVTQFLDYCTRSGMTPALDPNTLAAFVAHLLDGGASPSTARLRQLAVRRFSAWLADENETDRDELVGVRPPKLDERPVDGLDDDQLAALIRACHGKTLVDRRDEAIVRLMLEVGARAGEIVGMTTDDVDLARGLAVIRHAKGGKARTVAFGPATGAAIDRYLRWRRRHRLAGTQALWLGAKGFGFGYDALSKTLKTRAKAAGIAGFHPHMLRHTFASRWLAAGGSEQGLMVTAGWSRRDMIDRYSQHTSQRRAHDEARRLGLGEL